MNKEKFSSYDDETTGTSGWVIIFATAIEGALKIILWVFVGLLVGAMAGMISGAFKSRR